MTREPEIERIIQTTFLDITERVSGLRPYRLEEAPPVEAPVLSLLVTAEGDYRLRLVLCAEESFLLTVARGMKRAPVLEDEEVEDYIKEYFNMVCGRIVSSVNRKYAQSARIGLAQLLRGRPAEESGWAEELCGGYGSSHGSAVMRGYRAPGE